MKATLEDHYQLSSIFIIIKATHEETNTKVKTITHMAHSYVTNLSQISKPIDLF